MKNIFAVLALAAVSLSTTSLRADLLGSKVTGTLTFGGGSTNYFDPLFGYVPADTGNKSSAQNVTITSDLEFGFNDRANLDTADFRADGLTLRDICLVGSECRANRSFRMTFTDPAFASATLLTNDLGVTFNLSGNTLTIDYAGHLVDENNATATFRIGSVAQTPEPGSFALVGTGLLSAFAGLRRRFTL